ncbi:MAG TPA: T9SS type A sorting domain-containing protein [Puia sp.]|nr:T9SS type A sorting domain-containing protein [Puia sp.]
MKPTLILATLKGFPLYAGFLLPFLSPSPANAQCGGCSYTETELTSGAMDVIPAGTIVCITTNTCLGATSAYPATCPYTGSGHLTINGILRICPGVTFSFDGTITGSGTIQIESTGRMNLYGTYDCNVHMTAVDPDIATGTSTSTTVGGCNSSACEPHFADGYAPFGVVATGLGYTVSSGTCAITGVPGNYVLPVQLLGWEAAWQGSAIRLSWSTPGKDQGAFFEVDYSTSGAGWQPLSPKIPGIDNSPDARYSFLATGPLSAHNFFRLRYEDVAGQDSYSPIQELDAGGENPDGFFAGPNPLRQTLLVRTPAPGAYTLQLLDVTGKTLLRRSSSPSGEYDCSGLAPGTYFLLITTQEGRRCMKKLVKD